MSEALSTYEILAEDVQRESLLIAGKDGSGKTSAALSMAKAIEDYLNPAATVYVVDTETGIKPVLKAWGLEHAPANLHYRHAENIEQVQQAVDEALLQYKPGDWILIDSVAGIWEFAQDSTYMALEGMPKSEYLKKRADNNNKGGVVPQTNIFWQRVSYLYRYNILDPLKHREDLNLLFVTGVTKDQPPQFGVNKEVEAFKKEYGADQALLGGSSLHHYPDTLIMLGQEKGKVKAKVLKDRNHLNLLGEQASFMVPTPLDFALNFLTTCRWKEQTWRT